MFAVPGWSLPSASLQVEKPTAANGGSSGARKRKRGGAKEAAVTADNVADLYEAVVEGKKPAVAKAVDTAKRPKKGSDGEKPKDGKAKRSHDDESRTSSVPVPGTGDDKLKDKKSKKGREDGKPEKKMKKKEEKEEEKESMRAKTAAAPPPASTLTPLQASMREKLVSARFRHLNETLYTQPSGEALSLFTENPEMFDEYHEGFRRQVRVWPENPVNSFLEDIRTRARIRTPPKGRAPPAPAPTSLSHAPLPRTAGACVIADLGCGDARLAESLRADADTHLVQVRSYDLQSNNPFVTRADIARLPLEDGAVNVAIFCLALMGTNWLDFIEEAYRVLHWKGELWVAEIKSRFAPAGRSRQQQVVGHSVGNRRKPPSKKETAARDAEARGLMDRDLAVEVDGIDDTRRETDVSAFVDALRKRGFLLNGERGQAVDLSNKMFVKMHFVKAAKPEAALPAPPKKKRMFQYDQGKEDEIDEAAILKPCVYKIR